MIQFKMKWKDKKKSFLSILLVTLGASLLGNMFVVKGAIATSKGWGIHRAGDGIIIAGYGSLKKPKFSVPPHRFWNTKILSKRTNI